MAARGGPSASNSTSSTVVTANGTAPSAHDQRLDPEVLPSRPPAPAPARRCRPGGRPATASRVDAVEHAGRASAPAGARSAARGRARPRRTARRGRATASPSPDRGRSPSHARSSTSSRSRYASGVHTQHVFHPSASSATSASSRSPLPPTMIGGVGCWTRGAAGSRASYAPVVAAVERARTAAEQAAAAPRSPRAAARAARPGAASSMPIGVVLGLVPPGADARRRAGRRRRGRGVASDLASTDAGRNASHNTSVPRRGRASRCARARRGRRSGRSTPWRSGGPPYFATSRKRWSDSQSES